MQPGGVLFSEMTPDPSWEADFHDWYDTEHIPIRMAAPGFLGAQRYSCADGPGFLAVYDLKSPQALQTDEYKRIKGEPSERTARLLRDVSGFTRYTGRLLSWQQQEAVSESEVLESPVLYSVFFTVPQERQADFNDWYTQDHVPKLLREPQWLGCRRYEIVDGAPEGYTHMALHHLSSIQALESPARTAARSTPWRDRLASESWFRGAYMAFTKRSQRFSAQPTD
jgi:hypothetical protein